MLERDKQCLAQRRPVIEAIDEIRARRLEAQG
jgi:hypothetical protein